jgi:hypothetical protein
LWVEVVASVSAAVSALLVVVGGLWAYFKFVREAPYAARTNLAVSADLLVWENVDLIKVECTATSVGSGRVVIDKSETPPAVAVFRITDALLKEPPEEWIDPCVVQELFPDDTQLDSGEVLKQTNLLRAGQRQLDSVAYRVSVTLSASGKPRNPIAERVRKTWRASRPGKWWGKNRSRFLAPVVDGSGSWIWEAIAVVPVTGQPPKPAPPPVAGPAAA